MYNALEIVDVFSQHISRKNWRAKVVVNIAGMQGSAVQFGSHSMVVLTLDCTTGEWHVAFKGLQASWGDYIAAIRNALYTVLNVLASAALPFEAPMSLDHMAIEVTGRADGRITVWWKIDPPLNAPIGLSLEQSAEYAEKFSGTQLSS